MKGRLLADGTRYPFLALPCVPYSGLNNARVKLVCRLTVCVTIGPARGALVKYPRVRILGPPLFFLAQLLIPETTSKRRVLISFLPQEFLVSRIL